MGTPKLWVWVGSSDDTLDVMRYVTATEQDIIGQTCVRDRIRELEAEVERLTVERDAALADSRDWLNKVSDFCAAHASAIAEKE